MSRDALRGISRVIKANTTTKSIETLQAEGKKRVRVVSSERVMAIIQAIVDDTINAEVGEITTRDRERIVSDTQERFSHVLKMQQDLEHQVDELRGSLRTAEIERERLRADKALLEAQCGAARLDAVGRDAAATHEATTERLLKLVAEQQAQAETKLAQRLEREFQSVAVCLAEIHETVGRAPAAVDAVAKLRGDFDALESRILGVERGSTGLSQRVLDELAALREATDDARTHASSVRAEQLREFEQRVTDRAAEGSDAVVRVVERIAERTAALDGSLADLRGEFTALAARTIESAAGRDEAVRALREHLSQNATAQADELATSFKGALEKALDKITRTMQAATARPIETNVEATDALLSKIFDAPDHEISSNLDDLDVEQRRSHRGILTSVDRLKQMSGTAGAGVERKA